MKMLYSEKYHASAYHSIFFQLHSLAAVTGMCVCVCVMRWRRACLSFKWKWPSKMAFMSYTNIVYILCILLRVYIYCTDTVMCYLHNTKDMRELRAEKKQQQIHDNLCVHVVILCMCALFRSFLFFK